MCSLWTLSSGNNQFKSKDKNLCKQKKKQKKKPKKKNAITASLPSFLLTVPNFPKLSQIDVSPVAVMEENDHFPAYLTDSSLDWV